MKDYVNKLAFEDVHLNRRQLAEAANISRSTLWDLEHRRGYKLLFGNRSTLRHLSEWRAAQAHNQIAK